MKSLTRAGFLVWLAGTGFVASEAWAHHKPGHVKGNITTAPTTTEPSNMARTFYVRVGGSDAADGLSDANAWATWARAITFFSSAANTIPGDSVLFRGGDAFTANNALIPNEFGTATEPFIIGSYGTGKAQINSVAGLIGGVIYNNQRYVHVMDLIFNGPGKTLTGSSNTGLHFDVSALGCKFLRVEIRNFSNLGINTNGDYCEIDGCYIHDIGAHGIVAGDPGDFLVVRNTEITAWGGNATFESGGRHGIYLEAKSGDCHGLNIHHPDAGVSGQAISVRKSAQRVYGNYIHDCPYGMGWFNYDPVSVSNLTPGFNWIYGNIMENLANYGFYIDGSAPAVRVGGPGTYKNTVDKAFVNNVMHFSGGGAGDYAIAMDTTNPDIDASNSIVNNIILGTPGKYLKLANPTRAGKTLVEKKNIFYGATQANPFQFGGVDYASLAAYVAGSGKGAGDLNTNPLLGASPTYIPQSGSPAEDVGATDGESGGIVYAAGAPYGPTATGWGYYSTAPEIGAAEKVPVLVWHGRGTP